MSEDLSLKCPNCNTEEQIYEISGKRYMCEVCKFTWKIDLSSEEYELLLRKIKEKKKENIEKEIDIEMYKKVMNEVNNIKNRR